MMDNWDKDKSRRLVEMEDHASMMIAHMNSILARFIRDDEEDDFDDISDLFAPVFSYFRNDAPWL